MTTILTPKTFVESTGPHIFLAGPIRGAPTWHDEAIGYLAARDADSTIVNPSRSLAPQWEQYVKRGQNEFGRQRQWERHYLDHATKTGAILFWLPGEETHNCEKAYGAMTRYELAQWTTRHALAGPLPIVLGSDGTFSELNTILVDLRLDAPDLLPLKSSLEETCDAAVALARQTHARHP